MTGKRTMKHLSLSIDRIQRMNGNSLVVIHFYGENDQTSPDMELSMGHWQYLRFDFPFGLFKRLTKKLNIIV